MDSGGLQKGKKTNKTKNPSSYDDEEEETYMYDVRRPAPFLNEGKNGVFDITMQTGINTAKSVFDQGSIFRTK